MILSHIVAVSRNFIIGKNNKLPWRMPSDARYFDDVTYGHAVIMGRKNYLANKNALPGRTNIVITHDKSFSLPDATVVHSIDDAVSMAREMGEEETFIVGGGEIYRQTLGIVDRIYITVIETEAEGDTFYPKIDFNDFNVISESKHKADKWNPFDWTYFLLGRM
ncbi:MAG TPA: dihydrofolate reductase [Bacteroidales bacterium]|nr:dihydrofolate reductase [Bacteroidales bacterium]